VEVFQYGLPHAQVVEHTEIHQHLTIRVQEWERQQVSRFGRHWRVVFHPAAQQLGGVYPLIDVWQDVSIRSLVGIRAVPNPLLHFEEFQSTASDSPAFYDGFAVPVFEESFLEPERVWPRYP